MLLHEGLKNLSSRLRPLLLVLGRVEIFANLRPHLRQSREAAVLAGRILREFVVQLRQFLFLDGLHLCRKGILLPGELFIRIFRFEGLRFAHVRAAQIFREAAERLLGPDVAHHIVRADGIAAVERCARELDLHVIAILRRAAFHGNIGRAAFAQFLDGSIDLGVADFDFVDRHGQILVVPQLKIG